MAEAAVGVLFLAVIGGLGGALLRDLLLQVPVRALTSPWLLPSAFLGGLLLFGVYGLIEAWYRRIHTLDAHEAKERASQEAERVVDKAEQVVDAGKA